VTGRFVKEHFLHDYFLYCNIYILNKLCLLELVYTGYESGSYEAANWLCLLITDEGPFRLVGKTEIYYQLISALYL
jgi:hypothetical protein